MGFPNWGIIDQDNYLDFNYNHHRAITVMTGKMSNITGFDFDNKEEYERLVGEHLLTASI